MQSPAVKTFAEQFDWKQRWLKDFHELWLTSPTDSRFPKIIKFFLVLNSNVPWQNVDWTSTTNNKFAFTDSKFQQINKIRKEFNVLRLWCRLIKNFQKILSGPWRSFVQNDLAQLVMNWIKDALNSKSLESSSAAEIALLWNKGSLRSSNVIILATLRDRTYAFSNSGTLSSEFKSQLIRGFKFANFLLFEIVLLGKSAARNVLFLRRPMIRVYSLPNASNFSSFRVALH